MNYIHPELLALLVCPRDHQPLDQIEGGLTCPDGHSYPVIQGVPVLLLSDQRQTHNEGTLSLAIAASGEVSQFAGVDLAKDDIDPFVQEVIPATNGYLYNHLQGKLKEYPIPNLRLPPGQGKRFLEVGCNWGRWCIAAARSGYRPVGIDPSLRSILAARRVARQLGVPVHYVVADGRYLPFADGATDQVFSYSVLQHISREDVRHSLAEVRRVLRDGGRSDIQMANKFGVRCLYHQARRGFREAHSFEVRYWSPGEFISMFNCTIGRSILVVDGFFSLNAQPSDLRFMPLRYRMMLRTSEFLRKMSAVFPFMCYVADSLCIISVREGEPGCRAAASAPCTEQQSAHRA